uniref:Uncharacterized protein n=1 Tax=Alexandrium monilatum TaxID=311494 RepID=A0A7S4VI64_9DINO
MVQPPPRQQQWQQEREGPRGSEPGLARAHSQLLPPPPPPPPPPLSTVGSATGQQGPYGPVASAGTLDLAGPAQPAQAAAGQRPGEPQVPAQALGRPAAGSDIVTLNVGGEKTVQRRRSTLCAAEGSLLASRFGGRARQGGLWRYEPDDGNAIGIRAGPAVSAARTGNKLFPGEVFSVSQEQAGEDGILYLKLADGRGWVFDRKPEVGVMCIRHEEGELDNRGRYFINYSPEVFMPLLDYLGMRETEGAQKPVPLPRGPEHARPEFEAMLRALGVFAPHAGDDEDGGTRHRRLDALSTPYASAAWWARGLAFELRAGARALGLLALEVAAAIAPEGAGPATSLGCSVHAREGMLTEQIRQPGAWQEVGRGRLLHRCASRLELVRPMVVRPGVPQCLYIFADEAGPGSGVIFGAPFAGGVSVASDDLQVCAGHFSTGFDDFSAGAFYPFSGSLEYVLLE